jgi:hypothetical protein
VNAIDDRIGFAWFIREGQGPPGEKRSGTNGGSAAQESTTGYERICIESRFHRAFSGK